ncbi:MAG: hypothetical protein ACTSXF_12140 [Promethearchaeota archaeon]
MPQSVYEHLAEQLDQVVRGRRFIISEIGKLKVTVDDLKVALESSNIGEIAGTVSQLKNFISQAVTTLGDLKNSISQLSSSVSALSTTVSNTYNIVKNIKASGGVKAAAPAPSASAPAYTAPASAPTTSSTTFSSNVASKPAPTSSSFSAPTTPKPAIPQTQTPAPSVPAAPQGGGDIFDKILNSAKAKTPAVELGKMIDQLRSDLSKKNPLNPILFELSMEAGRLKSLGSKTLDAAGIQGLAAKIQNWKAKSK